ncbi:MAG: GNAT family N-acetyltransferase [Actinobacteria bacterium]|nr:GNAT family N-acetyltransferase [Actinomycetota bacterium]
MVAAIDAVGERSIDNDAAGRFLSNPSGVAIGGYFGEAPSGYLIGYLVTRADGRLMLIIYDVGVAPSSRRRGVASGMVSEALSRAARDGASKAWVLLDRMNEPARQLYRSTGAEPSGVDDLVMWWPLP